MLIKRKSIIDGKMREKEIPVTEEQYQNWENGMLIQDAMPNLTPGEREYILTGISEEEWDDLFDDRDE